jgi:hypothetical protein
MTEDDNFLHDVAVAWPDFLPVKPDQRDQYNRLLKQRYVEPVPITPMAGDDPLACRITERGKQYLHQLSEGQ